MFSHPVVPHSLQPHDCSPPVSSVHRQEYWSGLPCPLSGDLPNPWVTPRSSAMQMDSLPSEPPGKPQNTGVGSLTLPNPGIEPGSPALQVDSLPTESPGKLSVYTAAAAAAAKSLQLCPTLCDPIDGSPPGSPIPGILQARTLEWVAISFSNA